jgi:MFS family permease
VLSPYADILRVNGARAFVSAGLVARLPLAMLGLGTVLLITGATDSYGLAGAVSATIAIANAIGAPQLGRLVDRFGQRRVLLPAMVVQTTGLLALVAAAATDDAPHALYFVAAFVTGCSMTSFGALVRSRWATLLQGERLQTAYALESVLDELVFTCGPVLVTLLATAITPAAGLLAALGFLLAGGLTFAAQRGTEPPVHPRHERGGSAIRARGLLVLALVMAGVGGVFGTVEVAMVAFAEQHGHEALAGPLLALHAISSGVAGVLYGARTWRVGLERRLAVALALLFVGTIPLALANSIGLMVVAIIASGVSVSPTLITSFALVEALVPRAALTEGFAWLSTSLGGGLAICLAVAGHVVDASSGHRAFVVAIGASLLSVTVALAGRRQLRPAQTVEPRPVAA